MRKLEREEKWIVRVRRAVLIIVTGFFLGYFIPTIFKEDWLDRHRDLFLNIVAYSFLSTFILIGVPNVLLMLEIRKKQR